MKLLDPGWSLLWCLWLCLASQVPVSVAENSINEMNASLNPPPLPSSSWNLIDETNTSFTRSLLTRTSISEWNVAHAAYQPTTDVQLSTYRPCQSLQILPWGSSVAATSFCYNGLLDRSESCNGMTFVDWDVFRGKKFLWWVRNMGICKLFDRGDYGVEIHNEPPSKFQNNSVVMLKLNSKYDNCSTLTNFKQTYIDEYIKTSSVSNYEKCSSNIRGVQTYSSTYSNTTRKLPTDIEFAALPRVHIILFVTDSWFLKNKAEVHVIASHWECYAKAHDYLFSLVTLPNMTVAEFFTRRHQYILDEFLHTAQYVAQVEGDSMVMNMGVSFERFISQNQHSIHLQLRENGEVNSGIYVLKNDMNSVCFLEYWMSFFAPITPELGSKPSYVPAWPIFIDNPNSDNGALVAAMALFVASLQNSTDVFMKCLENLHPSRIRKYPEQHCFGLMQRKLYFTFGPEAPTPTPGKIRLWWHREGFWRTALHARDAPKSTDKEEITLFESLYTSCYPSSDFIGHGNKLLHLELEPYQSTSCDVARIRDMRDGGRNPKCRWLNEEEELKLLRKHCQWRSPACLPQQSSDSKRRSMRIVNNDILENICLYIPDQNSTAATNTAMEKNRNPNCRQSSSTINFVEV